MNLSVDFFALAGLMGTAQGALLGVALLKIKRGNRLANRILAFFLLTLALELAIIVIHHSTSIFELAHLVRVETPLVFAFGPFLFLYAKALTSDQRHFSLRSWLHFAPLFLYLLYLLPFYLQSEAEKISYCLAFVGGPPPGWHADMILGLLHFLTYTWLTSRALGSVQRSGSSANLPYAIYLPWSRELLIGFTTIWIAAAIFYTYQDNAILAHVPSMLMTGMVFYTGFKGLTQPEILAGDGKMIGAPKYANSTLSPAKAAMVLSRLQVAVQQERLYTDSGLTLPALAKLLSVSSHHLSQILNEKLGQNFFEYVNSRRIEEARRMLQDPTHSQSNVADIAVAVGFNSISAFNTAFKRHTNLTPSQFRKR